MTEDDARTKWCPFVRWMMHPDGDPHPAKHVQFNLGQTVDSCIASECMAFRWSVDDPEAYDKGQAPGYCGLAGKP